MNKMLDRVKEELIRYKLSNDDEKEKISSQNRMLWFEVSDKLDYLCSNDEEYSRLEEKISDIKSMLLFDFEEAFTNEIIAARGYEGVWDEAPSKLRKDVYDYHIDIATHTKEYSDELNEKIQKIENAKLVINKEKKIQTLKEEIAYNEKFKKIYDNLMELKRQKEYYKTNEPTLLTPMVERRNEILFEHSKKVIAAALKEYPTLICNEKEQNSIIGRLNGNETYMLFKVFNELRKDLVNELSLSVNNKKK